MVSPPRVPQLNIGPVRTQAGDGVGMVPIEGIVRSKYPPIKLLGLGSLGR